MSKKIKVELAQFDTRHPIQSLADAVAEVKLVIRNPNTTPLRLSVQQGVYQHSFGGLVVMIFASH